MQANKLTYTYINILIRLLKNIFTKVLTDYILHSVIPTDVS